MASMYGRLSRSSKSGRRLGPTMAGRRPRRRLHQRRDTYNSVHVVTLPFAVLYCTLPAPPSLSYCTVLFLAILDISAIQMLSCNFLGRSCGDVEPAAALVITHKIRGILLVIDVVITGCVKKVQFHAILVLHSGPRMAHEPLHRNQRLVSYVRVRVGHELHDASLSSEVGQDPGPEPT